MTQKYEDYIPEYPSINDEDFYRKIVGKKEFWHDDNEIFFRHQINIARYLSQWTLFDSLFMYHEMGTGKSGATVALTESFRGRYKKVIYITHNEIQIQNYKNEILKFSPRLSAMLDREEISDPDRRRLRWNKILANDGYEFYTMGVLYNEFTKRARWLKDRYDYSIIIVDEAHHLVQTNKDEDKKSYEALGMLLDAVEHKKCLIMTGTPIRDQPDEIVPLLNLILPKKLDRAKFIADFFTVDKNIRVLEGIDLPIYAWKDGSRERFRGIVRGRVSYLRREMTNVDIQYMGRTYAPMTSIRLSINSMIPGSIQNETYLDVFQKEVAPDEKKKSSFYTKSKQASLFVFPDQTIGEKAFDKYVSPQYTMRNEFMKLLPNMDLIQTDVKLEFLSQFSATYTAVIREIVKRPDQLAYVFSDLVEQSGILLFMSLLKSMFGYTIVKSPQDISYTPGARMILLNDQVCHENHYQQLIAYFNDPANKNGQLCQILMSTNKTKEGISLMNIQQIHIMTPSWNMADISQAMSRGLRARSHDQLDDPHVRIFLHTAVPFIPVDETEDDLTELTRGHTQDELLYSIDFQRYYRSEIKEKNAKLLERIFLESSWDCLMNTPINTNTGRLVDGSRECEYNECRYTCDGVEDDTPMGEDASNWRLFYSTLSMDHTIDQLRQAFREHSIYSMNEIRKRIKSSLVDEAVSRMISTPMVVYDNRNLPRFVATQDDIVFLVDNPFLPGDPGMHYYYQMNPSTQSRFSLHDMMDSFYLRNVYRMLPRLLRMIHSDHPNAKIYFESFPLSFQQMFCEIAVQQEITHPESVRLGIRQWFIRNFRTEFSFIPGIHIDHRFVENKKHPRRLDLQTTPYVWTTVS